MDGFDFFGTVDSDWEIDSDSDGEDDTDNGVGFSADHVLVFLDCGPNMWKGVFPDPDFPDDLLSPFDFCLQRLTKFLKAEIRHRATLKTGRRNGFGVYLYNTLDKEHVEWDSPLKASRPAAAEAKDTTSKPIVKRERDEYDDEDSDDEDNEYNTLNCKSTVHELVPLEPPGIATIKTLQAVQDNGIVDRAFDIQENYAPKTENHDPEHLALQSAFTLAASIVQNAKCIRQRKANDDRPPDRVRLWLLTCEDIVGEYVHTVAKDLVDGKVEIVLWPLPHPAKELFDFSQYATMEYIQKQTEKLSKLELLKWWQSSALLDGLETWKIPRTTHRLPLLWPGDAPQGEDPEATAYLQTNWYRLVQTARRPNKIVVHQETGIQLNTLKQIVDKESISQEILYEQVIGDKENPPKVSPRLCSYVEIQGTRIPFSSHDKSELKAKSHPHLFASLRVLGFRPADSIDRTTANTEQAYFCLPSDDNEGRIKGNRPPFTALHKAMMDKNVLMMGEVLTRKTATTKLVAAWALPERTTQDGDETYLVRPPGLLVIVMPWRNEIKKPIVDEATKASEPLASEALVEQAKAIINGLTVSPELGEHFTNTSLELFWDKLEELALNNREPRKEDESYLTQEFVVDKVGKHLDQFMELLPEDPIKVKKKREREIVPDDSGIDYQEVYENDGWKKITIPNLKKFLRSLGEAVSGNKQELIHRIIPHLQKSAVSSGT